MNSISNYMGLSMNTDKELYAELKEMVISLYNGKDKPLECVKGDITRNDIVSDFSFLIKLVEIYRKLSHIPAGVTILEFNQFAGEVCRNPSKHDDKFYWIQWVFEHRLTPLDKPSVVECVYNTMAYRRNVTNIRRRMVMDMIYHYQEYLAGRTPVIDQRNKVDYIAAIKDSDCSFFKELKTTITKKYNYNIARAQYLLIEKVIKQQKAA